MATPLIVANNLITVKNSLESIINQTSDYANENDTFTSDFEDRLVEATDFIKEEITPVALALILMDRFNDSEHERYEITRSLNITNKAVFLAKKLQTISVEGREI